MRLRSVAQAVYDLDIENVTTQNKMGKTSNRPGSSARAPPPTPVRSPRRRPAPRWRRRPANVCWHSARCRVFWLAAPGMRTQPKKSTSPGHSWSRRMRWHQSARQPGKPGADGSRRGPRADMRTQYSLKRFPDYKKVRRMPAPSPGHPSRWTKKYTCHARFPHPRLAQCAGTGPTCHRDQQILVIRNRRNRPLARQCELLSARIAAQW